MGSLRLRLLALTAFVVAVSLATVALLSRQAVRSEFRRFERVTGAARLDGVAEILAERHRRTGSWQGADSLLTRLSLPTGHELLLVDSERRPIAASSPRWRAARVRVDEAHRITLEEESRRGGVVQLQRASFVGTPRAALPPEDGAPLGTLYLVPRLDSPAPGAAPPFERSINRWLLLAVGSAGALALLLTLTLSRRILGPVEALTAAARRMERGDLSQRVPERGRDEIGQLARAFNAMADSVARNESLRRGLVGDVAHELRTPLTNLRCQIEAIQDGLVTAHPETIDSLHEEVLLLARLVEDLQELALAEAGRLALRRAALDVANALEAARQAIGARARERAVTVRVMPPAQEGSDGRSTLPRVDADPERLAQVLRNLVENAVAHASEGGMVELGARVDGEFVAIEVRDSGEGIAPEHLPHVFDRFYRADPSRSRATGNAGLGLAIVKQLVEAHGGAVGVESAPGAGATFRFTLPVAR